MRAFIITTFIGCFGINEKNNILSFVPFSKEPLKIAERMKLSDIEIIPEEKQVQNELWDRGYKEFVYPFMKKGVKHLEHNSKQEEFIKQNIRNLAIEKKFVRDQAEFNKLLTAINLELTKVKIKEAVGKDNFIIQVNGAIDEIDKSVNVLSERLREWYGLHFPEMNRFVDSHEKYANIVEKFGSRKNIKEDKLSQILDKSMGADLAEEDIKIIQTFASHIIESYKLRSKLSKYLEKILKEVAPNTTVVAGSMLAAKLISLAGGLDKLAKMPSSTIQLIGAEKALFRHLHGRGRSPKHGILIMHPMVQKSPKELKGKVARAVAAKLSIAARIDHYSKEDRGKKLKKDLEERIKYILSGK